MTSLEISNNEGIRVVFWQFNNKEGVKRVLQSVDYLFDSKGTILLKNGEKYIDPFTNKTIKLKECIVCVIYNHDAYRVIPIFDTDESIRYILASMKLGPYAENNELSPVPTQCKYDIIIDSNAIAQNVYSDTLLSPKCELCYKILKEAATENKLIVVHNMHIVDVLDK